MKSTHLLVAGLVVAVAAAFLLNRPAGDELARAKPPAERAAQPSGHAAHGHPPTGDMPPGHPPTGDMPPGHPPARDVPPGHPPAGSASASGTEEASLKWTVPKRWKEVPSPSPMRLATYRLPGSEDAECSVVRAGGTPEANIERWIGQFDEGARSTASRSATTVHGLRVSRLELRGSYLTGRPMGAASSEPRKAWALIGLVVEAPGSSYFFKVTGPEAAVTSARADVDALAASLSPTR